MTIALARVRRESSGTARRPELMQPECSNAGSKTPDCRMHSLPIPFGPQGSRISWRTEERWRSPSGSPATPTAGQRSSMIDVGKRFYSRIWKGFVTKTEGFSMPTPTGDQVFISYSHKDAPWRDDLDTHLKPYLRGSSIVSWSDQKIAPGSEWFSEVRSALSE